MSAVMRAMVYRRFGGAEALELASIPEPKMPQNSILVLVRAAGINPADLALQRGFGAGFMETWFPVVPGWDLAGVVERVGAGVSEFQPGDAVIGYLHSDILHNGTYAEKVAGSAVNFVAKPAGLDWEQAGALPLAGLTALQAIRALDLEAGETLLIHGASGGVGSLAAQLAVARGVRVLGTSSASHQAYLHSLGVIPVLYGEGLAERVRAIAVGGVDAVLDCAGKGALAMNSQLGRPGMRAVSIADAAADTRTVFVRPSRSDLAHIAALAADGGLKVRVAGTFPLEEAPVAQQMLASGTAGGKLVLML